MSEDLTRSTAQREDPEPPVHGRVGPADPHADPATDPAMRPVRIDEPGDDGTTTPTPGGPAGSVKRGPAVVRTRMSGLWTGLVASAVVLVFLLIFILQNDMPVRIHFLGASGTLPTGVALLFAAIAGVLLVAIPGALRILQLRRAARRGRAH